LVSRCEVSFRAGKIHFYAHKYRLAVSP